VNANNDTIVKKLKEADAVFIGGGFSDTYQTCFFGGRSSGTSKLLEAIKESSKTKLIGGSSAGSMVQPLKHILMTTRPVSSYQAVMNVTIPNMDGSDLFDGGMVDSHFSERGRQGRLFVHIVQKNIRFGFGCDEDSGLIESKQNKTYTFLGSKGNVVFDNKNRNLKNGIMHYLTQDDILLPSGEIIYPAWKTPCKLTTTKPQPSTSIFNHFKIRSFQVALYNENTEYSGLEGNNPPVEVKMKKNQNTKVMCGEKDGKGYVSFSNMFVSMAAIGNDELNGRIPEKHINMEPYYIDD